jgi:tRNA1Val (adenine37-N6)-methyltransferase
MVTMANDYFQFKQFTVWQQHCAMKVTTDACLFGAWAAEMIVDGGQMTDDSQKHPLVTTINNVTQSQTLAIESRPTANDQRHPSTDNRQLSTILDIGTGTGLLGLMLAQKSTHSIDAVEIDPLAAEQAAQNIQASPWNDRITVIKGDITQLELAHRYHTIISNPPFFENQLASPDAGRQKALHASELSLSNLFTAITRWLHPQGRLLLLLPAYRLAELEKLAVQHRMQLQAITWVKQTPRHEPFRMMVQLGYTPAGLQQNTITIREADQQYSEAFTTLLKDYYLHL